MNRDKFNKQKVLDYVQRKFEDAKEMNMFKMFRKSVETGANGTQKYMVKNGKNKGKILWQMFIL